MKKTTTQLRFPGRAFFAGLVLMATTAVAANSGPWASKEHGRELTAKRTRTAKHFENSDGSATAYIASGSIHYFDGINWRDIGTDIQANTGNYSATHPFAALENSVKTYFPANPVKDALIMISPDGEFRELVKGLSVLDASGNKLASLPFSDPSGAPVVQANRITYKDVRPGVDLVYTLGNDGRKFELVIHSAAFIATLPSNAAELVIEEEMSVPANAALKNSGAITVDVGGTDVIGFVTPFAFDGASDVPGHLTVKKSGITLAFNIAFPMSWIASNQRTFPLTLDPTVNYYPQNVNFWTGYQTSGTAKANGYLRIAAAGTACWAKFDISALPAAAIVQAATFWGYHYTTNTVTKFAEARSMTVDPVPATAAQIFAEATGGTLYNTSFLWGTTTYQWNSAVLNNAGITDLMAAKSQGWFAMGFTFESGSTTFQYLYGWNGTNPPYIEITYVTTPCTGNPPPNGIVSPTFELCSGEGFNFVLDSMYNVAGLTYQWQSSTLSPVGPFTPISGATLEFYNATNITTNTWYNLVVTCSNSTGTVLVSGGTITVAATYTSAVPFHESFETIGLPNRLPNCSWSAPNLGSSFETHTSAGANNLIPNTGSGLAAFVNPGGDDYVFTHGILMHAGVTYSASVWYVTDLTGAANWTNLELLIGTSQSTTGLTSIASTNGPAVAIVHKSLSNTFTVPTTGLYYIAVRATGSSGTAPHLAWDDLRIEIPCDLNQPPLAIVASNNTVCAGQNVILTATGADVVTWSNNAGTGNVVTVNPLINTLYTAMGTSTLTGCGATASQYITVNPAPNVNVLATPPNICAGDIVTLHGFGADNYSWSTSGTGNTTTVAPQSNASYSVQGVNAYGCTGSASIQLTVNPLPSITTNAPTEICKGDAIEVTASGATTYKWMSSNIFITDNPVILSPQSTTNYTVHGTNDQGCTGVIFVQMVVNDCVGLAEQSNGTIKIYPVPATDVLHVEAEASAGTLQLLDVAGRVVANGPFDGNASLDIGTLPAGLYYLHVRPAGQPASITRILKQ